jgi:DNA-binding PadR family transcriptional regulator
MSSNSNRNLGEFEMLVLAAILRQDGEAYGITIREDIEQRTGRSPSLGALYATLSRLEKKALVSSRTGGATAERGGRAKRFYRIEPLGQELLERSVLALRNMTDGLVVWRVQS